MTKATNPYSRLYWSLIDDEKFVDIYTSDTLLALWTRLLLSADMAWPASAALPFGTRRASVAKLVEAGVVDVLPGNRYRIHGLDAERGKRQHKASNAAVSRWDSSGDPGGNAHGMLTGPPSNANGMPRAGAEPSQAETRRALSARDGLPNITPEVQEAGEAITGQGILSAGDKQLTELDRLCEQHGDGNVIDAFRRVADGETKSWRQLVWDSMKLLEPFSSSKDTQDTQEAERRQEADTADKERWARSMAANKKRAEELGMQ